MPASRQDLEQEAHAAERGQLKNPTEASQGVRTHHVRWVLAISLTLGVVALGGAFAWYAASQHPPAPSPAAAVAAQQSNG
ncbi:MAG TPA: hypothetical protein VFE13_17755 [Caulobacteraceae bacterium]|jgi:hypothetical protein|nr:hypothetical protein [Caulobacteraceae bacterium]